MFRFKTEAGISEFFCVLTKLMHTLSVRFSSLFYFSPEIAYSQRLFVM
jgi:hypothetical protein